MSRHRIVDFGIFLVGNNHYDLTSQLVSLNKVCINKLVHALGCSTRKWDFLIFHAPIDSTKASYTLEVI